MKELFWQLNVKLSLLFSRKVFNIFFYFKLIFCYLKLTGKHSEKIYQLDSHLSCVVSGVTADANYLIDEARKGCQDYRYTYRDSMPIQQLITRICDLKQYYTQFGGRRPFGTSFLFAGWDKVHKFQLYSSDPSGNYAGWKAIAIGTNNLAANSYLKQEYKEDLGLAQGIELCLKTLLSTLDTAAPNAEKSILLNA